MHRPLRDQVRLQVAGSELETTEDLPRQALREVLGGKVYDAFFDRSCETFFADDDAAYLASLGLNCVR